MTKEKIIDKEKLALKKILDLIEFKEDDVRDILGSGLDNFFEKYSVKNKYLDYDTDSDKWILNETGLDFVIKNITEKEELVAVIAGTTEEVIIGKELTKADGTIDYAKIQVQRPLVLKNLKLIFEAVKTIRTEPSVLTKTYYNIWKAKFGEGNKPIFLIVKPDEQLTPFNIILTRMTSADMDDFYPNKIEDDSSDKEVMEPDKVVVDEIIKELGVKEFVTNWQTLWIYNDENYPIFYTIGDGLKPEMFEKVLKNVDLEALVDDFLLENQKKDTTLVFLSKLKLAPLNVMKYNPHSLWITNTKSGKSVISSKLGVKYDSGSGARLLGFATADRIIDGELNEKTGNLTCDEITEAGYPTEFFDSLPNILETGVHTVAKGSCTIRTKTTATFNFATNPRGKETTPTELMMMFSEFLEKFTQSPQRVGSRIGVVWFGNNYDTVKQDSSKHLTEQSIETNNVIVHYIMDKLSELSGRIIKEEKIVDWLETPLTDYGNDVHEFLKEGFAPQSIKGFWLGQVESYRHLRGATLQSAVVEYAIENKETLLNGKYDVERIIELAEESLGKIIDINVQSLRNMLNIAKSYQEYSIRRFEKLEGYKKVLVALVSHYFHQNPAELDTTLVPFSLLSQEWDTLTEKFKFGIYTDFSILEQKIPKKVDTLNTLINVFGFGIVRMEKDLFVKTTNKAELKVVSDYIENLTNEDDLDKSDNEEEKTVTQITQNTQFTQSLRDEEQSKSDADAKKDVSIATFTDIQSHRQGKEGKQGKSSNKSDDFLPELPKLPDLPKVCERRPEDGSVVAVESREVK